MNVADLLLSRGAPDAVALVDNAGTATTYAALRDQVERVAAHLEKGGAAPGDRALLVSENTPFFVVSYLAALRTGLVVVPVDPVIAPDDLAYIVESATPKVAFVQKKRYARLAEVLARVPVRLVDVADPKASIDAAVFADVLSAGGAPGSAPPSEPDRLAALMFTSGSTGRPRGVMISHGNIAANTAAIAEYLSLTAADRIMAVLPFHYCYGASLLHTHLSVGGTVVIDNRFMFADKVLDRMVAMECTGFAGVPSHFQILLRNSKLKTMKLPNLRYVQQAGGKLAESLIRELADTIAPAKLFVMYGQTEATARLSYLPPDALATKLGSIGKGVPGVKLHVLDEGGAPVSGDAAGEIVAEGPSVARGYWKDEAATAATFKGGRLHTGDIARVDADGFIYIVDRAKDFLKCGGVRTSSLALESVLYEIPEVVEAAVIAIPDDLLGEAPCAFLVLREGTPEGDAVERARKLCTERLAPELVPKVFRVEASLPKTASGKLSKLALRSRLAGSPS